MVNYSMQFYKKYIQQLYKSTWVKFGRVQYITIVEQIVSVSNLTSSVVFSALSAAIIIPT